MNPLTNVKNVNKMNQRELEMGLAGTSTSWHAQYKDSAWIFVGGLPYDLSEGDVLCIFSQYGEIVNINMVRDPKTGKTRGFCFICFEDQRSTILSVDNLNGIKVLNRTLRVDHVNDYKPPKEQEDMDEMTRKMREEGCAPVIQDSPPESEGEEEVLPIKKIKKEKKKKKDKKKKKKATKRKDSSESDSDSSTSNVASPQPRRKSPPVKIKQERPDSSLNRASNSHRPQQYRDRSRSPDNRARAAEGRTEQKVVIKKEEDWDRFKGRDRGRNGNNDSIVDKQDRRPRDTNSSRDRPTVKSRDDSRNSSRDKSRDRSRDRGQGRTKDRSRDRSRDRSPDRSRDRGTRRSRDRSQDRSRNDSRDRSDHKKYDRSRDRSRDRRQKDYR